MPGFNIFKSENPGTPRSYPACVTVGGGGAATAWSDRQMLVVGGVDGGLPYPDWAEDPDPLLQGLGIFDMTAMQWVDAYDPDAAPYDSPDEVQDWYEAGGLDIVPWTSSLVLTLFATETDDDDDWDVGGTGTPSPNATSSTTANNTPPPIGRTGTIITSLVGGVCALTIVAAGAFLMVRRRRQARLQRQSPQSDTVQKDVAEDDDGAEQGRNPGGMSAEQEPNESPTGHEHAEMSSSSPEYPEQPGNNTAGH